MISSATPNLPDVSAHQHLLSQEVARPPNLPPELERQIFETCAFDHPKFCPELVLVSKAVYAWIDPILISTICIMEDIRSREQVKIKSFIAKLTSGKNPVEYYARHVKSLALFSFFSYSEREVDVILAICTGVKNLAIKAHVRHLNFFDNPQAGTALRRLYIDYWQHRNFSGHSFHACFRNITHLHLRDMDAVWPYYTGWETLTHLTHVAFESFSSDKVVPVIQILPVVQYVALAAHYAEPQSQHNGSDIVVDNSTLSLTEAWEVRVVLLGSSIPLSDWERGARGKSDFWDVVENEVERRLREGFS
ncbi:hypothetical protein HYPSUDRAFT_82281 [Hypholoma sublateritium FD-334 SS-4]|uniref:F-box domain-containing protein n=1 Tax=Hypholoma sublateritium (strain FD-334 SS-4) TaxID=945553 RepID=A0A0D2LLC5_HYPSF|nr:hypothetical protein HYPSUDRAFT_82281 [Hypholoma sublateritium FD-334 SS-4]